MAQWLSMHTEEFKYGVNAEPIKVDFAIVFDGPLFEEIQGYHVAEDVIVTNVVFPRPDIDASLTLPAIRDIAHRLSDKYIGLLRSEIQA